MSAMNKLGMEDLKIEKGELDTPSGDFLYLKGVLNILNFVFKNKKFQRPKGKQSPQFSLGRTRFEPMIGVKHYPFLKAM